MTSTVLRGGLVVDGSGAEPRRADVRLSAAGISEVGEVSARPSDRVLDITGLFVLPGFIDTHVHAAPALDASRPDVSVALVAEGVTTVILGGDGIGPVSGGPGAVAYANRYFAGIDGVVPAPLAQATSVAELLDGVAGHSCVNVGYLVPAGSVRQSVMGSDPRGPNTAELATMVGLVECGLTDGALGLATGLEYVPGCFAESDELAALCQPVAAVGGVHASHMRGYEWAAGDAIAELVDIAATSGVRTHVAHLRASADVAEQALEQARQRGVSLTFDSYPYVSGCTLLAMKTLPSDLQARGRERALAELSNPQTASALEHLWATRVPELGGYVLAGAGCAAHESDEGLTLAEAAERAGLSIESYLRSLLASSGLAATCVVPSTGASGTLDVDRLAAHQGHLGCSDGIYIGGHPHPRGWGAFTAMIRRYVRETATWTWGQAAWHLSGHAASRFGLTGRGTVTPGAAADLVVLDPDRVRDRATYEHPRLPAVGVEHVFVGGTAVLSGGRLTAKRPGRGLRRGVL